GSIPGRLSSEQDLCRAGEMGEHSWGKHWSEFRAPALGLAGERLGGPLPGWGSVAAHLRHHEPSRWRRSSGYSVTFWHDRYPPVQRVERGARLPAPAQFTLQSAQLKVRSCVSSPQGQLLPQPPSVIKKTGIPNGSRVTPSVTSSPSSVVSRHPWSSTGLTVRG